MEYVKLNSGHVIPQAGVGVFTITDYATCKQSVLSALSLGYRHVDTARIYNNERAVGEALEKSGVPREEIFLTTKLWVTDFPYEKAKKAIDQCLEKLRTHYIDLVLLHRPYGKYIEAWRALEEAVAAGKVRSIGLSNFTQKKTDKILSVAKIQPAVDQIELHPYYQRRELKAYLSERGIVTEAWYPLGHGDKALLNEPLFSELGKEYGKSAAQIILRWHLQEGNIIFPRAVNPKHIRENIDLFDFELTKEEMERVRRLDKNKPYDTMPDFAQTIFCRLVRPTER